MKALIPFYCMAVTIMACNTRQPSMPNHPKSISVSLIVDTTDPFLLAPIADPLLTLFQHDRNPESEMSFILSFVTNKALNQSYTCHLRDAETLASENSNDDPHFRRRNIDAFFKRVRKILTEHVPDLKSLGSLKKSQCILAISNQIASQINLGYAVIHVAAFTNLFEHSPLFNCYTDSLTGEKLEAIINDKRLLPNDLSNVRLSIVFNPKTQGEDIRFYSIANAWRDVIERRRGRFTVYADNQNFNK